VAGGGQDLHGSAESVVIKQRFDTLMTTYGFHPSAAGPPALACPPPAPAAMLPRDAALVGALAAAARCAC